MLLLYSRCQQPRWDLQKFISIPSFPNAKFFFAFILFFLFLYLMPLYTFAYALCLWPIRKRMNNVRDSISCLSLGIFKSNCSYFWMYDLTSTWLLHKNKRNIIILVHFQKTVFNQHDQGLHGMVHIVSMLIFCLRIRKYCVI